MRNFLKYDPFYNLEHVANQLTLIIFQLRDKYLGVICYLLISIQTFQAKIDVRAANKVKFLRYY